MIGAYDKCYLEKARTQLAVMLDFTVNVLGMEANMFFERFSRSLAATLFEQGDPWLIAGRSGVELSYYVLDQMNVDLEYQRVSPEPAAGRSREYWAGWALAYYQWKTGLSFEEIRRCIPLSDIIGLYEPYHEMDILQFTDLMDEYYRKAHPQTRLKYYREALGLSQRELSEQAEVPLRTLQQYEQRQKNINKAQAEYLIRLIRALSVEPECLIERIEV